MHWNYRVIKHLATDPKNTSDEEYFGMYEVYYNEDGTIMSRTESAIVIGDTFEELEEVLEMMMKDLTLGPILIESEIDYNHAALDLESIPNE